MALPSLFAREKYYSSYVFHDKKNDKYYARVRYKDPAKNGTPFKSKRIPQEIAKHGDRVRKKYAEEYRAELNAQVSDSQIAELTEEDLRTVDDVVYDYLDYQLNTSHEIDEGTHYRNLSHYNKHISPVIGNYGFKSLNRHNVMDLYEKLNAQGLSQNTIYHYVKVVAKVYNYYHILGEIPVNPFRQVKKAKKSYRQKATHLTPEQVDALFTALDEEFDPYTPMYTAVYLVYYAGLRRGEICGLRWRNISFETGKITIDTAIGTTKGKKYTKLPKGDKVRTFPIVPQLLDYLEELEEEVQPERNWFVVGDKTEFLSPHMFTSRFTAFRKKYDLKDAYDNKVIPHGIRHNFATSAVESGGDIAAIAEMMGHSNTDETLNTYADSSEQGKQLAASQLTDFFIWQAERSLFESSKQQEEIENDSRNSLGVEE